MGLPLKVGDLLLNLERFADFKSYRKVKHMNMRDIRVANLYVNYVIYENWNSMVGLSDLQLWSVCRG